MSKPNYHFTVTIYFTIIVLFSVIFGYFIGKDLAYASFSIVIVFILIIALVGYLGAFQKHIKLFFESIKYHDFSIKFYSPVPDKKMVTMYEELNKVIYTLGQINNKNEGTKFFLQNVTRHVNIPLLVLGVDSKVELSNLAFEKLMGEKHIQHLQEIESKAPFIYETIKELKNRGKSTVKGFIKDKELTISISSHDFVVNKLNYTIVTFMDISLELENKELESWVDLLRILNHEMMNSLTPIKSLSTTAFDLLNTNQGLSGETLNDLKKAIGTIEKRSIGLEKFVGAFKELTKIQKPILKIVLITDVFKHILDLMSVLTENKGVSVSTNIEPSSLKLTVDEDLIVQALINLYYNAIDSVSGMDDPTISFSAYLENNKTIVSIQDNGTGISEEAKEKIFIPFYTTKRTGTGVGLSIVKVIMQLHHGQVVYSQPENGGSVFKLVFS